MFKIQFETINAAFSDHGMASECSAILDKIAARVRDGEFEGRIRDTNGNTIGSFSIDQEQPFYEGDA